MARRKTGPEATSDRTVAGTELKKLAYLGKNQLPENFNYDLFDSIPYLNGGLFDKLAEDNASDTIEDGAFTLSAKGRPGARPQSINTISSLDNLE